MSGFDEYVKRIAEGLNLPEAAKERIRQEALAHLVDEAERLVAGGKTREEAEALAVEAFGKDDTIARLVDEALAGRQERYRRKKAIAAAAVIAAFGFLAVALGTSFSFVEYILLSGLNAGIFYRSPNLELILIFAVVQQVLVLVAAALIAYRVSHAGRRFVVYSALGVFAVTMATGGAARLLHWGAIYMGIQNMSLLQLFGVFCLGLAGTWLAVAAIGAWGFFLRRDRGQVRLFLACLAIAAARAAWGAVVIILVWARTGRPAFLTWSNHVQAGLALLSYMMLVWFLARAMSGRRERLTWTAGAGEEIPNGTDTPGARCAPLRHGTGRESDSRQAETPPQR